MQNLPAQGQTPWGDALNQALNEHEDTFLGRLADQDALIDQRLDEQNAYIASLELQMNAPADTQIATFIRDPNSDTRAALNESIPSTFLTMGA